MQDNRGFTLIELLTVIAIIAVLSMIGIASFTSSQRHARDAQRKNDLRVVQVALQEYYTDNPSIGFPNTADSSTLDGTHITSQADAEDDFEAAITLLNDYLAPSSITDPRDNADNHGYGYRYYSADGSNYTIATCLENTNDTDGTPGPDPCDSINLLEYSVTYP
jgi:prepilin-type N-terminal cleavage/methylation domain